MANDVYNINKSKAFTTNSYLDWPLFISVSLLLLLSTIVLYSIANFLFPTYFLFIAAGIASFFVFLKLDFDILSIFAPHLYVLSVIFLLIPLVLGEISRGAVRWIPLGSIAIQPSEIVRPFILLFFAYYLTKEELNLPRLIKAFLLLALPLILILIQPSLGVTILTFIGFVGVLFATTLKKKYFIFGSISFLLFLPLIWFLMADYQKLRILTFINPNSDPYGAGYNSIQSMISVGSGKIFGRGLGSGVQTQLFFLPEPHNDFIFASIAEELGLIGVSILLGALFVMLARLIKILENSINPTARAFVSGVFLVLFVQVVFNAGMNMGLFPVSGIPIPLVSSGGSSLVATMITLSMVMRARRH